jgi:hypothetical protein
LSGAEDHFQQTRDGYYDFWRDHAPAHGEVGKDITVCGNSTYLTVFFIEGQSVCAIRIKSGVGY